MLLALKMEEGGMNPGTQTASKKGKRQGKGFAPRASRKKYNSANTLLLAR